MIGLWKPNWELANNQIKGDKEITEEELIAIDCGKQFKRVGEKIACVDFIRFQYGETLSDKSPIHKKVVAMLEKGGYSIDTLSNRVVSRVGTTLYNNNNNKAMEEEKVNSAGWKNSNDASKQSRVNGSYESLDFNWDDEKKKFISDTVWHEVIQKSYKIDEATFKALASKFLKKIESAQDYKTLKELKKYFCNWYDKILENQKIA